jgi:hypothetical protein
MTLPGQQAALRKGGMRSDCQQSLARPLPSRPDKARAVRAFERDRPDHGLTSYYLRGLPTGKRRLCYDGVTVRRPSMIASVARLT